MEGGEGCTSQSAACHFGSQRFGSLEQALEHHTGALTALELFACAVSVALSDLVLVLARVCVRCTLTPLSRTASAATLAGLP